MKRQKKINFRFGETPEFRRVATLSALCALGLFMGYFTAGHISSQSVLQLKEYLQAYVRMQNPSVDGITFLRAIVVYYRYILCIFLLSFTAMGLYLIPLVFAIQGFGLAFAVVSFSRCAMVGPLAVLALFALRCLIVLPITLYFGSTAMQVCAGKESRNACGFWRRLGVCICVLFIGTVLETAVVPHLFSFAFQV